jgi:uncharacterized coiled-coil DUF342 family protein
MAQMSDRFDCLEKRLGSIEGEVGSLSKEVGSLKDEQSEMRKEVSSLKVEQNETRKEVSSLKVEQNEMRKEVAFYYGSLMKEHENTRIEMRSCFKHVENSMNQHRGAIELLGERTKDEEQKES